MATDEGVVPTCPADVHGEPCGSQHWIQREEATARRHRVLWAAEDNEGYPSPRGYRSMDEGEPVLVEGRWNPTDTRDEWYACENGHEPDEATLNRLWKLFAETEPFDEDELGVSGPTITGMDIDAVEGAAQ